MNIMCASKMVLKARPYQGKNSYFYIDAVFPYIAPYGK